MSQSAPHPVKEALLDLMSLLWPVKCLGCALPDREVCSECRAQLRDGVHSREVRPRGSESSWHVAGDYDGLLRTLLVQFKHHDRVGFGPLLGGVLAIPLTAALAGCTQSSPPLIVPIPSRPSRVRERGYNHLTLLLRHAVPHRGRVVQILAAQRHRTGQVGLSAAQRLMNARRITFRRGWAERVRGQSIILVDDVITTGATVIAAEELLRHAGARVVATVALCQVVKKQEKTEISSPKCQND